MAVPTVMLAMIASFALATATIVAAVGAQSGSVRDQDAKAALAAAEAGVDEALLHYNRIVTTDTQPCIVGTPAALAAAGGDGWCAPVNRGVASVQGASYTYWVRPTVGEVEIVSLGNVSGVTRKVDVVARSSAGLQPFGDASVIGLDSVSMYSNALISSDIATNGDITMSSNAELTCNYAHVGVGYEVDAQGNSVYNCPAPAHGTISLPPVNQGDVPTNNSNARFFAQDTYTSGAPSWNATTRELTLNNNTTLTLGGANYSFCKLTLNSNSSLFIAAGATVRIYFDSPENCGYTTPTTQLSLNSNSSIEATGSSPTHFALLFVGSDSVETGATLNSNTQADDACEQDFVVYGPRTHITLNSNSYFCGAMAGKSIQLDSNSDIKTNNFAKSFELPNTVAHHFAVEDFVECTPQETTPPDGGC